MRKLFIVSIVLFSGISLFAQSPVSKNSIILKGSMSYSSETYDDGGSTRGMLKLNPGVGYFLFNNFALLVDLDYTRISAGDLSNSELGLGPAARYYFKYKELYPFLTAGYYYSKYTLSNNSGQDTHGSKFVLGGGLNYFISKSAALEMNVNYSFNKKSIAEDLQKFYPYNEYKSKTFFIGFGLNIFIN